MSLNRLDLLRQLAQPGAPILLLVLDGVGDLPQNGVTALERARTPNLDALAARSNLGLLDPVDRGITPGSGLGHLSLFGYDVYTCKAERGVLESLGVGLELDANTVAARGNFVTLDSSGNITDRRAGRLDNAEGARIVAKLAARIRELDGALVALRHVKEYRFVLTLRGPDLGGHVADTDPQRTGVPPLKASAGDAASARTAALLDRFVAAAREVLADEPQANGVTLRGIGKMPDLPTFSELYGMRAAAVANYPMYLGVGALVGMTPYLVTGDGEALAQKVAKVRELWGSYDFVFMHVKKTDSSGEDGDQAAKASYIEAFDAVLPELLALDPAPVLAITGDHSTPASMRSHSWHPVPVLVHGPHMRSCPAQRFTETAALSGALGRSRGIDLMPELLAQAGRLKKFGA